MQISCLHEEMHMSALFFVKAAKKSKKQEARSADCALSLDCEAIKLIVKEGNEILTNVSGKSNINDVTI